MTTESITIQAYDGTRARIARLTKAGKAKRRAEGKKARWARRHTAGSGAERVKVRAEYTAHIAELRRLGKLLDTVPTVVELGAHRVLAARGWDHEWPPLPPVGRLPGRWPGSMAIGVPERIAVRVDVGLVERVRAACWHESATAIAELRVWRDVHPGLVIGDPEALEEYERLAALVTTPGDVWRDGLDLVLPLPARPVL